MQIRQFTPADTDAAIAIWAVCGLTRPWNDPRKDIERKKAVQPELFLVGEVDGKVIATGMAGYEGHRGWVNYLAVEPSQRGQGYGRDLMVAIEDGLERLGCPKVNLQVRTDNAAAIAFYQAIGYSVDASVSLGKRLIAD